MYYFSAAKQQIVATARKPDRSPLRGLSQVASPLRTKFYGARTRENFPYAARSMIMISSRLSRINRALVWLDFSVVASTNVQSRNYNSVSVVTINNGSTGDLIIVHNRSISLAYNNHDLSAHHAERDFFDGEITMVSVQKPHFTSADEGLAKQGAGIHGASAQLRQQLDVFITGLNDCVSQANTLTRTVSANIPAVGAGSAFATDLVQGVLGQIPDVAVVTRRQGTE